MTKEELYNKIDKFCNETDWSKYPTYEHALEEFINGIVAEETKELEKENAELKTDYKVLNCSVGDFGELQDKLEEEQRKNNGFSDNLTKAKEILKSLYFIIESRIDYKNNIEIADEMWRAEQFWKGEK